MRRRGRVLALLGAMVALLLTGCGLPNDDRPRLIAAEDAPIDLSPTTSAPTETSVGRETVAVFFVNPETGRLQAINRRVMSVTATDVLTALFDGLLDENEQRLLDTAIPTDVRLRSATVGDSGVLLVDLTPGPPAGIQSVTGQTSLQAFAQIVQTATALSGIGSVRFAVEGTTIAVLTDNGSVGDRPVVRSDFASLAPAAG